MNRNQLPEEHKTIRELSDRLVEIQRPIRVLDAIKWGPEIQQQFFAEKGKELPAIDQRYYDRNPLSFDPHQKLEELHALNHEVTNRLGHNTSISRIMHRMIHEYEQVVHMLNARGQPHFAQYARKLYGSAEESFYPDGPNMGDLARLMASCLPYLKKHTYGPKDEKVLDSQKAVELLSQRLNQYFTDPADNIQIQISDEIVADAAAGAETIKVRRDAMFSEHNLRLLEVHEGWVHLGTTINGRNQPILTFLSKGPPSSTITQEGLAVIMEIFTFSSYPIRLLRLTNRIIAISMVEQGANFLEVYRFFLEQGNDEAESYDNTVRVFRGSTPEGKPFPKDLAYSKGFVMIYNLIRLAIQYNRLDYIPLLFVGKTNLEELHLLASLQEQGILKPPKYIPPQIGDIAALSSWMSYSLFMNKIDLGKLAETFKSILQIR